MSSDDPAITQQLLAQAQGLVVKSVRLIGFVSDGKLVGDGFLLELGLSTGPTLLLCPSSDGESLRVVSEPWRDPFEEPIDAMNAAFVKQHGKWSVLDLSGYSFVALLVGQELDALSPVLNQVNKLVGLQIRTRRGCVNYLVEWDEGHMLAGCEDSWLTQKGYHLA